MKSPTTRNLNFINCLVAPTHRRWRSENYDDRHLNFFGLFSPSITVLLWKVITSFKSRPSLGDEAPEAPEFILRGVSVGSLSFFL